MGVLDNVAIGMTAETTITVSPEMTVGHFVAGMPQVYATPMMILHNGDGVRLRDRLASA
jgi:fluoroacetyl-CoA thioesterase